MVPDRNHDMGPPAGVERGLGIGFTQRKRLLAVEMLADAGNRFHLAPMHRVRGCKDNGSNRFVGQNLIERSPNGNLLLGREISHRFRFERDAAHEAQRCAEVARRLHQRLAPPSETYDRGIQPWHPAMTDLALSRKKSCRNRRAWELEGMVSPDMLDFG